MTGLESDLTRVQQYTKLKTFIFGYVHSCILVKFNMFESIIIQLVVLQLQTVCEVGSRDLSW